MSHGLHGLHGLKRAVIFSVLCLTSSALCFAEDTSYISHNELVYQGEAQYGYRIIGSAATNDTALADDTKTWDDGWDYSTKQPKAGWYAIPEQIGTGILSFYAHGKDGNDPNAGTFDAAVTVISQWGSAKKVFNASLGVGNIQLSRDPNSGAALRTGYLADPNYKWASEATALTDDWGTGVLEIPEAGTSTETDVFEIYFDTNGAQLINVKFTNIDSRIDYVYCVMRGTGK